MLSGPQAVVSPQHVVAVDPASVTSLHRDSVSVLNQLEHWVGVMWPPDKNNPHQSSYHYHVSCTRQTYEDVLRSAMAGTCKNLALQANETSALVFNTYTGGSQGQTTIEPGPQSYFTLNLQSVLKIVSSATDKKLIEAAHNAAQNFHDMEHASFPANGQGLRQWFGQIHKTMQPLIEQQGAYADARKVFVPPTSEQMAVNAQKTFDMRFTAPEPEQPTQQLREIPAKPAALVAAA